MTLIKWEKFTAAQSYLLTLYNIPRRLLPQATKITPGKRAPTVTSLDGGSNNHSSPSSRPTTANGTREEIQGLGGARSAEEGIGRQEEEEEEAEEKDWVAVNSMVKKKEVADVMDRLKELGATDILCLKIENSRGAA